MQWDGRLDRRAAIGRGTDVEVTVQEIGALAHAENAEVVTRDQRVTIEFESDAVVFDGDSSRVVVVVDRNAKASRCGVTRRTDLPKRYTEFAADSRAAD